MSTSEWIKLITIPFFTGVIGWLINWTALIMLFNPVRFHGWNIPGLYELSRLLPRKLQEVPGVMQGGVGWQGIIPARAAKMGSISVDKAIAKLGTPAEFFNELATSIEQHKAGTAKLLAVTTAKRIPELPDVPTLQESGVAGFVSDTWNAISAPLFTSGSASSCRRSCTGSPTRSANTSTNCSIRRSS